MLSNKDDIFGDSGSSSENDKLLPAAALKVRKNVTPHSRGYKLFKFFCLYRGGVEKDPPTPQ